VYSCLGWISGGRNPSSLLSGFRKGEEKGHKYYAKSNRVLLPRTAGRGKGGERKKKRGASWKRDLSASSRMRKLRKKRRTAAAFLLAEGKEKGEGGWDVLLGFSSPFGGGGRGPRRKRAFEGEGEKREEERGKRRKLVPYSWPIISACGKGKKKSTQIGSFCPDGLTPRWKKEAEAILYLPFLLE